MLEDYPLTILEARGITKRFGSVTALDSVDLDIRAGEVHALLGENGSGKSTLLSILSGEMRADSGDVFFMGERIRMGGAHDAISQGIFLIAQEVVVAPQLSVCENICLGRLPKKRGRVDWDRMRQIAESVMDELGVFVQPNDVVGSLPLHHQQMVAIARALASRPRVVMLDEPTSSLSSDEVDRLLGAIRRLRDEGVAVVFVSHRLAELREIASRVTVLRDGKRVEERDVDGTNDAELVRLMVGRELSNFYTRATQSQGRVALEVDDLSSASGLLQNISLSVRRGEVVGVAGVVGSGRTLFARCLYGLEQWHGGYARIDGELFRPNTVGDAIASGVSLLPEDRKDEGLLPTLSVQENIDAVTLHRMPWFRRSKGMRRQRAQKLVEDLDIRCSSLDAPVVSLSGGNQQKVVLARCLSIGPKILILDEPTRGVDVGAKAEIYRLIAQLAESGTGIIVISSEMMELIGVCHRIVVFRAGRLVGEVDGPTASEEAIARLATGVVDDRA